MEEGEARLPEYELGSHDLISFFDSSRPSFSVCPHLITINCTRIVHSGPRRIQATTGSVQDCVYWSHELRFYDTHESCMHHDRLSTSVNCPLSSHPNLISRQRSLSGCHWCSRLFGSRCSGEPRRGMITSERGSGYRTPGKVQQVGPT